MPVCLVTLLAVSRGDLASYVNGLFTVFIILIFVRILMSWIPRLPDNAVMHAVAGFIRSSTDPYLNIFRRILPPVGGGGFAMDLSPIVGVLLLLVAQTIVVGIVNG